MQGGQGSGRGVYLARRIVAVLVILLLLVLLVPRACQAFLGPEEEPAPFTPDTGITDEEIVGEAEDTPADRETEDEISPDEIAPATDVGEDEGAQAQRELEAAADLAGTVAGLEAPLGQAGIIGHVPEPAPVPISAIQQPVQPPPPVAQPTLPAEPVIPAEPVLPAEPTPLAEPVPFAAPSFFERSLVEDPLYFEQPTFLEEGIVPEKTPSDTRDAAPDTGDKGGAVAVAGSSAVSR